MKLTVAVAILAVILVADVRADDTLIPEPARPSDSLVESIGVATHFTFHNSMYCTLWDTVQSQLGSLGVRNIRDALDPRQDKLWERYGIQVIAIDDDPGASWETKIALWKEKHSMLAAIEGPNEVNGGWKKLRKTYQGKGWPDGPHQFQEDLFKAVKSDPELKSLPVIALSTAYKGDGIHLAPLTGFDYANTHSYPAGAMPSASLDFRDPFLLLGYGAVLPPLAATETGYHTCLGNSKVVAGSQSGVSHTAQKKYVPRLIAEYFNSGFRWTVLYEFGAGRPNKSEQEDPEAAFGLLMPDATPKPAYFALKDLISVLAESKWDSSGKQWIRPAPFAAQALTFALRGAPDTVHHTLLQRSDGSFQLLLWNEVPSFDRKTKGDIPNHDVPVRLELNSKAELITVSRLGPDSPPPQKYEHVSEVDLMVPDEVIVVGIKLAEPLHPASINAPTGIEANASPTSIDLSWPVSKGADAYWVSLNRGSLGRAKQASDGMMHFIMKGLTPDTTYPFEIVAAARNGGVSAPGKISATTVNAFPDLIVKSLRVVPDQPEEGEAVHFVAVVANVGNAPTEEGTLVGTKFSVDGKAVCWNDSLRGPVAPGQVVEVKPTNGFDGRTSWVVKSGIHRITAFVDDANRISESDETNNTFSITIGEGRGTEGNQQSKIPENTSK